MQFFRSDYKLTPSFDFVGPSFRLLRDNVWTVFCLNFLPNLLIAIGGVILVFHLRDNIDLETPIFELNNSIIAAVGLIAVGFLWVLLAAPGFIYMQLQAAKGNVVAPWECFKQGLRYIVPLIVTGILSFFAIFLGFLALIFPGVILYRSFFLSQFYVVDRNLSPIDALKQSRAESIPNAGPIWGTIGVVVLFSLFANSVTSLPVLGYILMLVINLLYVFGPVLRYNEIKHIKIPATASSGDK